MVLRPLKTLLTLSFLSLLSFTSNASALSSFCQENGVAKLEFSGIAAMPLKGDLCRVKAEKLPPLVSALIRDMGRIHHGIAQTIGQSYADTVGPGFVIDFAASGVGSMGSYALGDGSGVQMQVFADWDLKSWSSQTYAHELIHVLSFRKGAFAQAVTGLNEHPFISEALPDLVSIDVHGDPVVKFEEGLPACLINRDATPTKSIGMTFGDYYTFSASDQIDACCTTLKPSEKTPHALALCQASKNAGRGGFYPAMQAMGATVVEPSAAGLRAPFRFEQCHYQMKGFDLLQACGTHSFAVPLSSFFMAIRKELGRSLVANWIQILKNQAPISTTYSCSYKKSPAGSKPASLVLRGIVPSLQALHDSLSIEEQKVFDRVWKAHDFDQLTDLDALFLGKMPRTIVLAPLSAVNKDYANAHGCSSVYAIDPVACEVSCAPVVMKVSASAIR